MKKRIFYPPLRDEFTKFGDKFEKIAHNEANGMYCYKRTTSGGLTYYEVFKAPKAKDEGDSSSNADEGSKIAAFINKGTRRIIEGKDSAGNSDGSLTVDPITNLPM